jgi:hypothetical protein
MNGLIRKATLLGVCGLLSASTALANAPSAAMSSIEDRDNVNGVANSSNPRTVVGLVGGLTVVGTAPLNPLVAAVNRPDPFGKLVIKVRDFLGGAVVGCTVTLDFNWPGIPCIDTKLCSSNEGLVPVAGGTAQHLICSGTQKQLTQTTDNLGNATFYVLGASTNTGSSTSNLPGAGRLSNAIGGPNAYPNQGACCKVLACGVELATLRVSLLDQDGYVGGFNGLNVTDVNIISKANIWNLHEGGNAYMPRHDINKDADVTVTDVNKESLHNIESSPGSGKGSGSGCPAGGGPGGYCSL